MNDQTFLSAALNYAKYGWYVFPCHSIKNGACSCGNHECKSPGKHPRIKHGLHSATSDESQIKEWWTKWPTANIGVKTGPDSKIWVVDADLPDGPGEVEKMNLPETLKQKTGSGGFQYFFQWNGVDIRNSAKALAPGVDIRGDGGYVIIPPSNHISGGHYEWINKIKAVKAPDWLYEKLKHTEHTCPTRSHCLQEVSPYAQAALNSEISKVSLSGPGSRNEQLYSSTRSLAQLVAGGALDENTVRVAMTTAGVMIGLSQTEVEKSIESAFRKGFEKPRKVKNNIGDKWDKRDTGDTWDSVGQSRHDGTPGGQAGDTSGTLGTDYVNFSGRFVGNLKDEIKQYILQNQGVITSQEIDREFGLTHRQDKKNRSRALVCLEKDLIIKKDSRVAGKYLILKNDIEWIDLTNIDDTCFDVDLPLGLNQMINLPPKCIVIIAGTSNAGKTAFVLELLKHNLYKPYKKLYMMSEMGPSEYVQRVKKINCGDIATWNEKVMSASISSCFDGPIMQHNPDGLTIVDFLEEKDGEYYKITSDIRSIYDALGNGVAVLALQKHSKAEVGRGGEGTTEKARLYLTIDTLAHQSRCTISAIKIIKAKDYPDENPNYKEIHVKISAGCEMEPISEWMYCNKTQREQYAKKYQNQMERDREVTSDFKPDDAVAKFLCDDRSYHYLHLKHFEKWEDSFQNIDVDRELTKIQTWSEKNPTALKAKNWFFQVSEMLRKENAKKEVLK